MPISTNINSPVALYALMTTTNTIDLSQSYTQTANIDMTGFNSQSIAEGLSYVFAGSYNGNGFTITIGNVVSTYTGLFDSITSSATITNVNVIYSNNITQSSITVWGGLVGSSSVSTISNCSVRINGIITLTLTNDGYAGLLCGFMGQESSITNSTVTINNTISIEGGNSSEIGLLCGLSEDSNITNCSIVATNDTYDISLTAGGTGSPDYSDVGLICGFCGVNFTALTPQSLINITVSLNNTGSITLNSTAGSNINKGAICGTVTGATGDVTIIDNCTININNNQILTGAFNDFFGQTPSGYTIITACQFNYITTTNNTSRPLTISPTPTVVPVIYVNSFVTNTYNLASGGNYYIPNITATILLGSQSISLESQTSPAGIIINGTLQPVGTTYSSSTSNYNYVVIVKGVGSMYFGFNYSLVPNIIDTPEECICQVNSCSTNPQTGVTADSRITNTIEGKTIRINVDREFVRHSVVYPKFKSYSDYMKYLQAGLKY